MQNNVAPGSGFFGQRLPIYISGKVCRYDTSATSSYRPIYIGMPLQRSSSKRNEEWNRQIGTLKKSLLNSFCATYILWAFPRIYCFWNFSTQMRFQIRNCLWYANFPRQSATDRVSTKPANGTFLDLYFFGEQKSHRKSLCDK